MLRLSSQSLQWALNHALNFGDTDIFPEAFEFQAIKYDWDNISKWLENEDILNWNIRPPLRCITPKHQYGFRISTQLDPIDFLIYSALIYEIGDDIETRRIKKENSIVHSYRCEQSSTGQLFSKNIGYQTFVSRSKELANESYDWVVTADIADFFPRLYHHRIKNALSNCTLKQNHAIAIDRLLSGWNESYSYGIPVGSNASRLLSEVSLDDVDKALLSEGAIYIRYSDDFRIFCKTKREAYEKLAFLANVLFENHGLTLQQHKTKIISKESFVQKYLLTEKEEEINRLSATFKRILPEIFSDSVSWLGEIRWENLSPEQQQEISELNLKSIIEEQIQLDEINIVLTRFVLRRLAQLGSSEPLDLILGNLEKFYPLIPDVVQYVTKIRYINVERKHEIGRKILDLVDNSTVSHLEFHRMWLLSVFTKGTEYNNEHRFASICSKWQDQFTFRNAIMALGRSKQDEWFRMRKRSVFDVSSWIRRAFLLGGSCLPNDERKHWYQSLETRLDPLEIAVTKWARQNPF
jgi:hypothetical protein